MLRWFKNRLHKNLMLNDSINLLKSILSKHIKTSLSQNRQVFCKAPFTSFNIKPNGIIGVCNVNTSYSYGTYPEKSLKEIWNGQEIEKLRKCIKNNDLSQGCVFCQKYLEDGNTERLLSNNYQSFNEKEKYPSLILFEMSHLCNLNCIMCFVKQGKKQNRELKRYDESFFYELKKFIPYLKEAIFHGGEPFLIKDYYRIWDLLTTLNPKCKITIITNGTILNDNVKNILQKSRAQILVSIESISERNYENIRVGANYRSLLKNLNYFIEHSTNIGLPLIITSCVMRQNWRDIIEIINFCNKNNCIFHYNSVFFPVKCSIWNSTSYVINEIIDYYEKQLLPNNSEIEKYNYEAFTQLKKQIKKWSIDIKKTEKLKNELKSNSIIELNNFLKIKHDEI